MENKLLVLYDEGLGKSLSEFGIYVPLVKSRTTKIYEWLIENTQSSQKIELKSLELAPTHENQLRRAHDKQYIQSLFGTEGEREIEHAYELTDPNGKPVGRYRPETAKRKLIELRDLAARHVAGTVLSSKLAIEEKRQVFFLGGGLHHAMSFKGGGFCLLNDMAVAHQRLRSSHPEHISWVIDVDVHKGDGTAQMATQLEGLVSLSIHMAKGWPLGAHAMPDSPSLIPSQIDIPIPEQHENLYCQKLQVGLDQLRDQYPRPQIIYIVMGSDPFEKDELQSSAGIRLSEEQMLERDLLLKSFLDQIAVPAVFVMAGGYGSDSHIPYINFLASYLEN